MFGSVLIARRWGASSKTPCGGKGLNDIVDSLGLFNSVEAFGRNLDADTLLLNIGLIMLLLRMKQEDSHMSMVSVD